MNDDKANDKVKTVVLNGKGYVGNFIFARALGFLATFFVFRYTLFSLPAERINDNLALYWGSLIGVSFCLYMATFHIWTRKMAVLTQFFAITKEYMENDEKRSELILAVRTQGEYVLGTPDNGKGRVRFKLDKNDGGDNVLTIEQ